MSAPFNTLYLDVATWDLTLDANGNIAMAAPPYAVTQDVASACRTFFGEVYYDTKLGVPYLGKAPPGNQSGALLGKTPALNVLQGALAAAALAVPWVKTASCVISAFLKRIAQGQVQFTTEDDLSFTVEVGGTVQIGTSPMASGGGQALQTLGGQILTTQSGQQLVVG